MKFEIKNDNKKDIKVYKSLYISKKLADQIEELATEHDSSWNNIVISMIEACLKDDD